MPSVITVCFLMNIIGMLSKQIEVEIYYESGWIQGKEMQFWSD